ncbi:hypothetical protein [Nocardia niwae]|uniref:Uncharacterized protein n=1 Tax=Nocardia niwae TaxID=626084 RepID=A0ABV2XEH1_9NOCA|nr:hypothetical protein [Nocardia niwae]
MPFVDTEVTDDGVTRGQKARLIKGGSAARRARQGASDAAAAVARGRGAALTGERRMRRFRPEPAHPGALA